jgi:hypothetical protein
VAVINGQSKPQEVHAEILEALAGVQL